MVNTIDVNSVAEEWFLWSQQHELETVASEFEDTCWIYGILADDGNNDFFLEVLEGDAHIGNDVFKGNTVAGLFI